MGSKKKPARPPRQVWCWIGAKGYPESVFTTKAEAKSSLDRYIDANGFDEDEGYRVVGPFVLAERVSIR